MNINHAKLFVFALLGGVLAVLLFACAEAPSLVRKHPEVGPGMHLCSDCHTDWRATLDHRHRPDYIKKHQFYASQQRHTCEVCHEESFCADCHANREEIKPSDKYKDAPERALPHRGDYLTQHKIDGRINPASCFPCHGRQNNERCKVCHR